MGPTTSSPTPQQPTFSPQPIVGSQQKPKKGGKILLITVTVLALLGAGALGYFYKTTNDALKSKSQELAKAYGTIGDFQAIIDRTESEKDFIAQYNDASLSRSSCSGQPLLMSDVHINDSFAVYRYLCANIDYETPIRIAAFKKLPDGSFEFTYGASTFAPNGMPDYIYDSEPDFFGGQYGATRY